MTRCGSPWRYSSSPRCREWRPNHNLLVRGAGWRPRSRPSPHRSEVNWGGRRESRTGETIAVNADTRFPTASTIKTAVMVEAWQQIADGQLTLETVLPLQESAKVGGAGVLRGMHDGLALTVADLINLMIILSDNTATNMLIGRVGTARVNQRLVSHGLTETKLFRPTFRDGRADVLPDLEREFGLGMTTPREMARLMGLIAEGKAVSRAASEAMLATLVRQQDRAMIPRLLPGTIVCVSETRPAPTRKSTRRRTA